MIPGDPRLIEWKHGDHIPANELEQYLNKAVIEGYSVNSLFLIEDKKWVEESVVTSYCYNVALFRTAPFQIAENIDALKMLLQHSFDVLDFIKRSCSAIPTPLVKKFEELYSALKDIHWIDRNVMRKD